MKRKRLVTSVLTLAIAFNLTAYNVKAATSFSDIEGHWASQDILAAVDAKFVDGYPDNTFKPDNAVTRAEFVKMLVTAMQIPYHAADNGEEWYTPYVNVLKEQGMFAGIEFQDMNENLSREEMAYLGVRSTDKDLQGKDVMIDYNSTMYRATKSGLLQGKLFGDLDPKGQTTRAQAVTVIERVLKLRNSEKLDVDKYAASVAEVTMTGSNAGVMWGSKIKKLPMDLHASSPAKVELEQVLVIDMGDDQGPYRNLIPDGSFSWREKNGNFRDYYFVAQKLKVTLDKVVQTSDQFGYPADNFSSGAFNISVLKDTGSSFTNVPALAWANGSQEVSGWMVTAVKKDVVNEVIARGQTFQYGFIEANASNHIMFFE